MKGARRAAAAFAVLLCCAVAALAQSGSGLAEPPGERFGETGEFDLPVSVSPEPTPPAPAPVAAEPAVEPELEPADEPSPLTFAAVPTPAPAGTPVAAPTPRRSPAHRAPARATADPAPAPASPRPAAPVVPSRSAPQPLLPVAPTFWITGALPDPLPPSSRLSPLYARRLVRAARAARVDWPLLLATLRARGQVAAAPAGRPQLHRLGRRLSRLDTRPDRRRALLALSSDPERALALASLYRAVGLHGLVKGLAAAKPRLDRAPARRPGRRALSGGREDLAAGRIDVRVLALLAVDIASVGGVPVAGSQGPGEQTERLLRSILLLPAELRPRQVISLIGLGGPSFALFDHDDHVHVGY